MIWLYTLFTPLILLLIWKFYKRHRYWKDQGVLEVKPWPIIGNMWPFLSGKHFGECLDEIYKKHDARCFGIYSFMEPVLLLKDADLIKQITIKDFDHFINHKNFFSESKEPVFKENLFALKGEDWRSMRRILSPAFTSSKLRTMFLLVRNCAEQFTNYYIENSKKQEDLIVDMKDAFARYTNDVTATCIFGVSCDSLKEKENEFFMRCEDINNFGGFRAVKYLGFEICAELMNFFKIRLFSDDVMSFFYKLLSTTMEFREKNNIYRPDLIHLLMEAKKGTLKNENTDEEDDSFATEEMKNGVTIDQLPKPELTDEKLAGQAFVFLLAGSGTSSIGLTFMAYELALNMNAQRKLQEEIDKVMEECKEEVSYEALMNMKYLNMVVTESLRLWSPVYYNNRICNKPYTIPPKNPNEKPIHLKVNDTVWFPTYAMHRDPKYYPNPDKFDPERFSEENKSKNHPYAFMPFGIGPRNCIGYKFAMLQTKLIIVYLLWKFDLIVVKETEIPVKINKKQLILTPANGIKLGFKLRKI